MLALAHLAVAGSIGYLVTRHRNDRLVWFLVAGGFGMLPDAHLLVDGVPAFGPIVSSLFLFHGVLDVLDPADTVYSAAILYAMCILVVGWTEYSQS